MTYTITRPYTCRIRGDISRADAVVLSREAERCPTTIIEFGPGGSTLILAESSMMCSVISYEHHKDWIDHVQRHLLQDFVYASRISLECINYTDTESMNSLSYTLERLRPALIFIDGNYRQQAFEIAFPFVPVGGVILLHDSRNAAIRDAHYWPGIKSFWRHLESIEPSYLGSNMIRIVKGPQRDYENWNDTEHDNNRDDQRGLSLQKDH